MANPKYVSTNLTAPARDQLRALSLRLGYVTGRRVSQSSVLIAALKIASQHEEDVVAALAQEGTDQ